VDGQLGLVGVDDEAAGVDVDAGGHGVEAVGVAQADEGGEDELVEILSSSGLTTGMAMSTSPASSTGGRFTATPMR